MDTREEIAEILIKYGAMIDSLNYFKNTPLSISIDFGLEEMVKTLIKHGTPNTFGPLPVLNIGFKIAEPPIRMLRNCKKI